MLSVTSSVLKLELWLILQMTGASDLSFEKQNLLKRSVIQSSRCQTRNVHPKAVKDLFPQLITDLVSSKARVLKNHRVYRKEEVLVQCEKVDTYQGFGIRTY